jgi:hypothetical protein
MVTRPACGIPAAPIEAKVAVTLKNRRYRSKPCYLGPVIMQDQWLTFINKNFEIRRGRLPENYVNNIVSVYTPCAFLLIFNMLLFHDYW